MKQELTEGMDYYFNEKRLIVLTGSYLTARGFCCGLACRHCPFNYEAVPESERSSLLQEKNIIRHLNINAKREK